MRKALEIGGFIAAAVLVAFGVAAIVMGVNGRNLVNSSLSHEYIVAGPDMTPTAIKAEAQKAGIASAVKQWPTMDIAGKTIDTGPEAQAMAQYMHIHALEATGGLPYSQMPRFATADGKGTNDAAAALQANGRPVDNAARNIWVTETALSTALNASYMAESLSLFGIVVGIALLLSGFGFAILAAGGTLSGDGSALQLFAKQRDGRVTPAAVPTT